MAKLVKNPPAMLGTWVLSLGREDPLDKEMAQDKGPDPKPMAVLLFGGNQAGSPGLKTAPSGFI